MSNLFGGGSSDQKKKITMIAIYATIAVIVCLLTALLITQIVAKLKPSEPEDSGDTPTDPTTNFSEETVNSAQLHSGSLILVNKDNEYIFDDNPAVVNINEKSQGRPYGLKANNLLANPTALSAFNEMMKDTYKNISGANIVVMTAYRSPEEQTSLNNNTPAGFSDFHTGMSFELKDGNEYYAVNANALDGKYDWLYENAHKYGFIVRYPDDIPASSTGNNAGKKFSTITGVEDYGQVFRYVGVAHATYIYEHELCLEEYLQLLRTTHGYENPLAIKGADGKSYEVYYAEANMDSKIQISSKYSCDISGDNVKGYIVTVNKSVKSAKTTVAE